MLVAQLPGTPTKDLFSAYNLPAAAKWLLEKATLTVCTSQADMVSACYTFTGNLPFRMQQDLRKYLVEMSGQKFGTQATLLSDTTGSVYVLAEFPQYKTDNQVTVRFQAYLEPGHSLIK